MPCRDAQQPGDHRGSPAQKLALAAQLPGDRDVPLMDGFVTIMDGCLALGVGHDRQHRGEQHQQRQRCYHGPYDTAGPPLLPDVLAFNVFLGNLLDGRRQRGDLVPESGVTQSQTRIAAGPGHIEILGLGWEDAT